MNNSLTIDIFGLLEDSYEKEPNVAFRSEFFERTFKNIVFTCNGKDKTARITCDNNIQWGMIHIFVSLPVEEPGAITAVLSDRWEYSHNTFFGILAKPLKNQKELFLIPCAPYIRQRDSHGRIIKERALEWQTEQATDKGVLEFVFIALQNRDKINPLIDELNNISDWEKKDYLVMGPWSQWKKPADFYHYIIDGNIYNPRLENEARCKSQLTALSLYKLADFLAGVTAKKLYQALKSQMAYSILLDLDSSGRWRHGQWADIMETHTRAAADGVQLLLDYYKESKQPIFLQKAKQGMEYLLSVSDKLKRGKWFLHDTLELNPDAMSNYPCATYLSESFGKNPANTLALNTHINTLCVLIRLSEFDNDKQIKLYIEEALDALKLVLKARPQRLLYTLLFNAIDASFNDSNKALTARISRKFTRKFVMPNIFLVKKFFPRFVMPNGYIDRDLGLKDTFFDYHIVNTYDLLNLYKLKREGWLLPVIKQAVYYCADSYLINKLLKERQRMLPLVLDVLTMYLSICADIHIQTRLTSFRRKLIESGYSLTPYAISQNELNGTFIRQSLRNRRRLNIAFTCPTSRPYIRRGVERYVLELANLFAARGHRVDLITAKPGKAKITQKGNLRIIYYPYLQHPVLLRYNIWKANTFFIHALGAQLKQRYDIVHCMWYSDGYAANIAKLFNRRQFIYQIIADPQEMFGNGLDRFMFKRAVLGAKLCIVPTLTAHSFIKKTYNVDSRVIGFPVDMNQFNLRPDKDLQSPRILCTSAANVPRKRVDLLVKAFELFRREVPAARLQLAGEINTRDEKRLFYDLSKETIQAIEILGAKATNSLPQLYAQAAMTVLPSIDEVFGMVLIESLSSGTPIVGTNRGGIPEIINDPNIGTLFEEQGADTPQQLSKAMLKTLKLAKLAETNKRCRESAFRYSLESCGDKIENLYYEALNGKN